MFRASSGGRDRMSVGGWWWVTRAGRKVGSCDGRGGRYRSGGGLLYFDHSSMTGSEPPSTELDKPYPVMLLIIFLLYFAKGLSSSYINQK